MLKVINRGINAILLGLVQLYRWTLSPYLGRACRFDPTCSAYAMEALRCHGPWQGGWLAVKRVCRCHPLGGFGFDPVPTRGKSPSTPSANASPLIRDPHNDAR